MKRSQHGEFAWTSDVLQVVPYQTNSGHEATQTRSQPVPANVASHQSVRRLLNDDTVERGDLKHKSRQAKADGNEAFNLPELPSRNDNVRRARLPPTLSGLHEPPPNAGLLPSISVGPAADVVPTKHASTQLRTVSKGDRALEQSPTAVKLERSRANRNKWTAEETASLLSGVARFGIGNWTKILRHAEYSFNRRTALDLKDRFRVCCRNRQSSDDLQAMPFAGQTEHHTIAEIPQAVPEPMLRHSQRRQRHAYSDVEDANLLKGFQKYGKAWAVIQQDISLGLSHRTRTDLRDRMRTRFPDVLQAASSSEQAGTTTNTAERNGLASDQSSAKTTAVQQTQSHYILPTASLWDPFAADAHLPRGVHEVEDAELTLDTGILDWALQRANDHRISIGDPISPPRGDRNTMSASALPSLASLTTNGMPYFASELNQPELPALTHFMPSGMEVDDRHQAFPSLEDLLRQ